jgi:hypothetical protein
MGLPVPSFNPNKPIPNTTFTSPQNFYVNGPWFPIEVGEGVVINTEGAKIANLSNSGVLDFSGVTGAINLYGGTGISVTKTNSDFTITNDGVVQLIAGGNISISGSNGVYTISASDAQTGTVTSVGTGAGLTGGPITTVGTISLDSSGVTPGSYTYPTITVDSYGRITVAANGTAPVVTVNGTAPVRVTGSAPTLSISVDAASTTAPGVVQLNDSTSSTSTTQALTANAGSVLQQQINALVVSSNLTLAGTIDASTGLMVTVTTEGASRGFAVGSPLPATASGNDNYFAIVTVAGTMTPPGGAAQACDVGDWWLSSGSSWQFLNVAAPAPTIPSASPVVPGVILGCTVNNIAYLGCLAGYTYSGDNAVAIGCQALPGGSGCHNIAIGTQVLLANSAGAYNTAIGSCALCETTTGSYNTAIGPFAGGGNATGSYNIHIGLVSGLNNPGDCNVTIGNYVHPPATGGGQLAIGNGGATCWLTGCQNYNIRPGAGIVDCSNSAGTVGQVLMSNGSNAICWGTPAAGGIPCSVITAKGDIVVGTAASTPSVLPVGTYGQFLTANSGCSSGLAWSNLPTASVTGLGVMYGCATSSAPNNTSIGYYSLAYSSVTCSIVLGNSSMIGATGDSQIAIGVSIGAPSGGTGCNVAIGNRIGGGNFQNSANNVVIGQYATCNCLTGSNKNVIIGANAALALDNACNNVIIGYGVAPPAIGCDCTLAIGYDTGCHWLTGTSTKAIRPGAGIIDCAGSCGTAGQVLMSNGSNAICWGTAGGGGVTSVTGTAPIVSSGGATPVISVSNATPLARGVIFGCTASSNAALGECALKSVTSGLSNTAVGYNAMCALTTAIGSTALGDSAASNATGCQNLAAGAGSLFNNATGNFNTAVGYYSMIFSSGSGNSGLGHNSLRSVSGLCNVGIGCSTGSLLTSGNSNVLIGPAVQAASSTGSCQLAIGFSATDNWVTGDSTKAIKPGAGIIDCAGSCGTSGQVLMSNGSNAICWGTATGCTGTVTSITAGTGLTGGTITTSGTIALNTACVIQPTAFTAKGDLLSASATSTPTALGVGTDGQVLSACSACTSGLVWATPQTSPFVTYTTSAVSYTSGTPLLVAKWYDGTMQGTVNLNLNGYGGIQQLWDFYLSGGSTNYNTGWYQTASYPASSSDPLSQGTWYVDFPVYPSPDANAWMIYFSPSQNSLNPSSFTFFYRLLPGSSTPVFQI